MRARTHIYFLCVCAFFLYAPLHTFAATNVTGDITSDTEWTIQGSPYIVNFSNNKYSQHLLLVASSTTLTIDPGAIVKFGAYNGMTVDGALHAEGTADNPIIFTSLKDDTAGGDTNGDGNATTPTDEQWMYLQFNTDSNGTFDNATVRYGGASAVNSGGSFSEFTGIENYGGTLIVDYTTLTHNGYDGLGQYGGHTTLSHSLISNQSVGISMSGGELDMSDTRMYDNATSGIRHSDGTLSITRSEIDHNGTGITATSHGSMAMDSSSIHDNSSFGIDNQSQTISIDVANDWWGDKSGPHDSVNNAAGTGNGISGNVVYSPWLTSDPFAPIPQTPKVSNVLFLPGIEGSRLYEGTGCGKTAEEKLWEPFESLWGVLRGAGDAKVRSLFLTDAGKSNCNDIYVKTNDIINSAGGGNIYKSFIDEMNGLKTDGTINDWKPVAYDWRLSLDDLLSEGTERAGKIYYEEATSTPYIEQTLRALAASSKTGKVTIVAHSNGGLVVKALMNQLGGPTATALVDKIIMVGVPQSGAPEALGSTLVGYDAGIYKYGFPIVSNGVAQSLAQNSPMAYHLLPSQNYFNSVASDANHPVARFAGAGYAAEESAYGNTIMSTSTLDDFLRTSSLNSSLIDYANNEHNTLDDWTPPAGIEVDQIAGWGADTVAGIDFYTPQLADVLTAFESPRAYRPIFTEDGDGIVPVPSALMIASSTDVKRYWVNLDSYRIATSIKHSHKDLFEIPSLEDFIKNIIENNTSTLPSYISTSQPPSLTNDKKLIFFLHSPLTLQLTDSSGNITGIATDDSITENIPDSTYGEFGDVKYVTVPEENNYQLTMHGQANDTFSLDIQETTNGIITASSTIASIPTTASTLASLTISGGLDTTSALTVDENGNGNNIITITPRAGETVNYKPPAPEPQSGSASYGTALIPVSVPVSVATTANSTSSQSSLKATMSTAPQTITQPIAADTSELATSTEHISIAVTAHRPKNVITPSKKVETNIPQAASIYEAVSQQPFFTWLGRALYNGLYGLLAALKKLF